MRADRPVHYHLVTSAFSYMGNDGQPDYGAVNESLNRLADVMSVLPNAGEAGRMVVGCLAWMGRHWNDARIRICGARSQSWIAWYHPNRGPRNLFELPGGRDYGSDQHPDGRWRTQVL